MLDTVWLYYQRSVTEMLCEQRFYLLGHSFKSTNSRDAVNGRVERDVTVKIPSR